MGLPRGVEEVPAARVRRIDAGTVRGAGDYVLYWMTAFRRSGWNFSLQRAVHWARQLRKPLVVFEPLRCDYPWASDRLHAFVVQGMKDNARRLQRRPVTYYPYLEPEPGQGRGLLAALAERACVVVGDDFPSFFLPRMHAAAADQIPVAFELIDSNGLVPLQVTDTVFTRAVSFRRWLQRELPAHLAAFPLPDPLRRVSLPRLEQLPEQITQRWPPAAVTSLMADPEWLSRFAINHQVRPVAQQGGTSAAERRLRDFLQRVLADYAALRNEPERDMTSGLSPYLHFGHISAHQVFAALMEQEQWTGTQIATKVTGSARGWWGTSESAEAFLDQLVTWRELSYNFCWHREDYDQFASLPDWARNTLARHRHDPRPHVYALEDFERAETHDPLWNATQRQLLREGRIHTYLRMLWGKKILHWSATPDEALEIMLELNNKYAVDGRNPNSYSGIFWTLGRYDRAWGPERPIFGKVRYMTSENTARKHRVKDYVRRYGAAEELTSLPRQGGGW